MSNTIANGRRAPTGAPLQFMSSAMTWYSDACLIWPFGKMGKGYGKVWDPERQETRGAHRMVCERVYGPPPSPRHEAAHSCGNGFGACINPRHLFWATPEENAADKIKHFTDNKGEKHGLAKLTQADVLAVRGLLAEGESYTAIGRIFNVAAATIRRIALKETWGWLD